MDTGISKETIAAFVDGELPPREMERTAAILAQRPDLDSYVRRQEGLRAQLRGAFSEVLDQPVPVRLTHVVRTARVSLRWRLHHLLQPMSWRVLVPASAALALGLVIGALLRPGTDFTSSAGRLVARGSLARALDHQLASDRAARSGPRIGISFRDKAGEDCRTFVDVASSGLACRRDGVWVIGTVVSRAPENRGSAYRMAGSEMPQAVRDAVTASISGEPFDAQTERFARDSGWK
jgi:hypothetical protein